MAHKDCKEEEKGKNVSFLFITANVGTLFEDLCGLQEIWIKQFIQTVKLRKPHFIALHFQEVGGKDYKSSMNHVDDFIQKLMDLEELEQFGTIKGYLDEDTDSVDKYTALGNFYFVHNDLTDVSIWDYDAGEFKSAKGRTVFAENLKDCPEICKEKFEQGFFPDCKWSRKGYTRLRWRIYKRVIEFVNIHLFHDDSNLVAIQSSPSPYSKNRRRALKFVLQRVHEDLTDGQDYFIFGDFNFRLDIKSLLQYYFASNKPQEIRSEDGVRLRLIYRDQEKPDKTLLKIEKKLFQYDRQLLHKNNSDFQHLKQFNEEIKDLSKDLKEFEFKFDPTYPYSEESNEATQYMNTRCPAWCDRVLLSPSAYDWLTKTATKITYDTIGKDVCMGDHKPIYLAFKIVMPEKLTNGKLSQVQTDENIATNSRSENGNSMPKHEETTEATSVKT